MSDVCSRQIIFYILVMIIFMIQTGICDVRNGLKREKVDYKLKKIRQRRFNMTQKGLLSKVMVFLGPLETMPGRCATFVTLNDAAHHSYTRYLEHGAQALTLQSLSQFLHPFIDLVFVPTA